MTAFDDLDRRLIAYYEAEAAAGVRTDRGTLRTDLHRRFAQLLRSEHRERVIDVGAGPGLDVAAFGAEGFAACGLEPAPANVGLMMDRGLVGVVGSIYALPFGAGAFDATWTMSTLVHVPDERFDLAMSELVRVGEPGAPIGVGSWGGRDWEGISDFTRFSPARFFSLRSHARWRSMLSRFGQVESFESFGTEQPGWEYQFAVIRG